MVLLRPYREMLETACAIHRVKNAYMEDPESLESGMEELRGHRLLAPHVGKIQETLEKIKDRITKSQYNRIASLKSSKPIKVVSLGSEIMARMVGESLPRTAHYKGILPLSGRNLADFRNKRRRMPPEFSGKPFENPGQLMVYPWGIHLVFYDPNDYQRFGAKGSGGMAYPGDIPVSFSTRNAEHILHETDHSFFHAIFPEDHPLNQAAQEADRQYVLKRVPAWLQGIHREKFTDKIVNQLVDYGYWRMRNESHSYITPLAENDRIKEGSQFSWKRLKPNIIQRTRRLLKSRDFESLNATEKSDLLQWVKDECQTVTGLTQKNAEALSQSPIARQVLSKIPLFLPYHQIWKRMPALNRAYQERKAHYEKSWGRKREDQIQELQNVMVGKLKEFALSEADKEELRKFIKKTIEEKRPN